jgi:[acyl-carrier-protein] S-malonyltransferase
VLAAPITDPSEIRNRLVEQVTGTVRWRQSMMWLAENGVDRVFEIGAGKVLTGLMKRIAPSVVASAVGTPEEIRAIATEAKG